MSAPLRVIVCGQTAQIANGVKAGLLPEYETIHVVFSAAAGAKDIPPLLSGQTPPATDEPNVGTGDYSKKADAIITGGAYDDEKFNEMRNACAELPGFGGVAWLRPNMSTPTPPIGPAYGKAMVERCKVCLKELEQDGKLGTDGIYFY
ncbi:hypothetical protein V495_03827 [Pseudogymnoascus sp. VKM F-4514 (FW-929)]|nr:hypothetical protein V495_03827 [Pseudogymnoascus sp. VKM F-4514 (FW-929)]KFY60352.1 hypothetical protein V497_03709 [Pseudogymnoascus sp. VKM F-4516 (FW-969)]